MIFGGETSYVPSNASGPYSNRPVHPSSNLLPGRTSLYRTRDRTIIRTFTSGTKLLFIRDNTKSPSVVAKMACPDCSRDDFTNLQGLLNHCRIRHSKDYGSHDECMQRCAVIVPEEDRDWIIANGTELSGISLPSLRRLFEIAVGNVAFTITGSTQEGDLGGNAAQAQEEVPAVTHLSRTLGLHKDTPALAPFLGFAPKRRCINVHNKSDYVDIGSENGCTKAAIPSQFTWRMSYAHRSEIKSSGDITQELDPPKRSPSTGIAVLQPLPDATNSGTRFHILARVTVADRSLWLTPGAVRILQGNPFPDDS